MNKFKVGDRVRLVKVENEDFQEYKNCLGKIFKIVQILHPESSYASAKLEGTSIIPYLKNLELVKDEYIYEDLKKAPIGTKITFQNGYLIKFDKERVYGVINGIYYNGKIDYIILFLKGKVTDERFGKIIKIEEPIYQTVYEHKEEILDEAEKRYLRGVIRPFRNRIKYVRKIKSFDKSRNFLQILLNNDEGITFPYFKSNTMYKGMKEDKEYSLEELGL